MLTKTALLLALCVAVQQFQGLSQFFTGPLVNAILIIAGLAAGLWGGLAIAVLSPVLAYLIAPQPILQNLPQMIIVIMIGNAVMVIAAYVFRNKYLPAGLVVGSIVKTGFLWLAVSYLVLPLFGQALPEKMKSALTATFSINQLYTALIGNVLAYLIWRIVKKAIATKA